MQYRMRTHQFTGARVEELLKKEHVATIATLNSDGTPYVTPIHFVYENGKIYFHGLGAGQKIENIKNNPLVSFNTYNMDCYLYDDEGKPCDTNTKYQSVNIQGAATLVDDIAEKREILRLIIGKYTPDLSADAMPDNAVKGAAVVEIEIKEITGKYWE